MLPYTEAIAGGFYDVWAFIEQLPSIQELACSPVSRAATVEVAGSGAGACGGPPHGRNASSCPPPQVAAELAVLAL